MAGPICTYDHTDVQTCVFGHVSPRGRYGRVVQGNGSFRYQHKILSAVSIPLPTTNVMSASSASPRKGGVADPEELRAFVEQAGAKLLVVDLRNPNAEQEPGDQKSLAVAPLPSSEEGIRPQAVHLMWDREKNSMPLPSIEDLDTPIITHCGGGGRGQMAKDFLMSKGFTNVLNGGGPKETDCWAEFGTK